MNRRRKIGAFLILLGIGIPLALFFFQEDETMFNIHLDKIASRKLTEDEVSWIKRELSRLKEVRSSEELGLRDGPVIKEEEARQSNDWGKRLEDFRFRVNFAIEAHSDNKFEEVWNISTHQTIEIPYMRIIGVGVFFVMIGLGFLTFSYFPKK